MGIFGRDVVIKNKLRNTKKKVMPRKKIHLKNTYQDDPTGKKLVKVQYQGHDYKLDDKIEGLAKRHHLDWDGTGYALMAFGDTPAGTREHFIYGRGKENIAKFEVAVKKLGHGIHVKITAATVSVSPQKATHPVKKKSKSIRRKETNHNSGIIRTRSHL